MTATLLKHVAVKMPCLGAEVKIWTCDCMTSTLFKSTLFFFVLFCESVVELYAIYYWFNASPVQVSQNAPDIIREWLGPSVFNNFWYEYSWHNWSLNDRSSFHLTQRLLLHYLEKQHNGCLRMYMRNETEGNVTETKQFLFICVSNACICETQHTIGIYVDEKKRRACDG